MWVVVTLYYLGHNKQKIVQNNCSHCRLNYIFNLQLFESADAESVVMEDQLYEFI
jgi:hypothetical protein